MIPLDNLLYLGPKWWKKNMAHQPESLSPMSGVSGFWSWRMVNFWKTSTSTVPPPYPALQEADGIYIYIYIYHSPHASYGSLAFTYIVYYNRVLLPPSSSQPPCQPPCHIASLLALCCRATQLCQGVRQNTKCPAECQIKCQVECQNTCLGR